MAITLVFVILMCLSYCEFSKAYQESVETHQDIVECVFAINVNSTITVRKQKNNCISISKQMLQNIGNVSVRAKSFSKEVIVTPGERKIFHFPITISTINISNTDRAIIYASKCDKNNENYINNPDEGYDRNKVLNKAFALGVKHIPYHQNLGILIKAFWSSFEKNVWKEIYAVIKDLLDVHTQQMISKILDENIVRIHYDMIVLYGRTKDRNDFDKRYNKLIENLGFTENRFLLHDNNIFNLYLIPLYTNYVTLKLYFYNIGLNIYMENTTMFQKICNCVQNQLNNSIPKTKTIAKTALDEMYNTVYAGALYNVMMNARSHIAWHIFEMFPKWIAVLSKCKYYELSDQVSLIDLYPISYSNLYGRATPDLLEQAIKVEYSPLVAEYMKTNCTLSYLNSIFVYIIKSKELETVYGLKLKFLSHVDYEFSHLSCLGTCKDGNNINYEELDLSEMTIITLRVYKSKYIRCLEFTLSDNSTKIFGNHCKDNSTNFEFKLEGHYIHSLYLANDYPETKKYFDNVAVSFLPKGYEPIFV